ncbi:MAG: Do family serine endopeptidase [Hyphomicrobiaceae bacterium]|nr:Do family serine endopeptidase [Hyphomicrobiaceae bacterium]
MSELSGSSRRLGVGALRSLAVGPQTGLLRHFCAIGAALVVLSSHGVWSSGPAQAQRGPQHNGPQSVAPVAEKLIDAVVNISTTQTTKGPQGLPLPEIPKGSPFDDMFEDFFNRRGGARIPRKVSSLGSGFVIDGKEGLVVTNNHVIADADEIVVNFHDGTKLKVDKVVGRDQKSDLALLKVSPSKPLADVKFGSSDVLKVGDWVMAIGNPFGLGGTVTVGIISAKSRDINTGPYDDFLQTDAAINRGNSGGPLFNMDGEVIGVNTAIISPTGGSIGIGFAIPSDTAVNVIEQLKLYGETRRGWLGVNLQSFEEDLAETLGAPAGQGALVAAVTPDGPAAKAGIAPGDVIVRFNGQAVTTMRSLPRIVANATIGKAVPVEVIRKGEKRTISVEIGRLADDVVMESEAGGPEENDPDPKTLLGLKLEALSDELRSQYSIGKKVEGVIVTEVDPGSAAAAKNIKPGDVIVEAAQDQVALPDDVARSIDKVKKSGRKAVLLRIEDAKGNLRFVAVPLG